MNFYDIFMFPLEKIYLHNIRKELISLADKAVLEIGFATGANVKYYQRDKITKLTALDLKLNKEIANKYQNIDFIEGSATNLPFEDKSMDTIVATLVFCSVEELNKAIQEVRRVLKDDGTYLFLEHVLPKNKLLARLFNGLNGPWHKMSSCNLNRETVKIFEENGFEFQWQKARAGSIFKYGLVIKNEKS